MRAMRASVLVSAMSIVALSVLAPTVARADVTAEAKKMAATHFAAGSKAFDSGDFARAADEFEAAYALAPHYDVLWNVAKAADAAGARVRAANGYLHYLREAPPSAPDRDHANQAIARLAPRLALMHLRSEGLSDVRLDAAPLLTDEIYVEAGVHVATGLAGGTRVSERVTTHEGDSVTVTLVAPLGPSDIARVNREVPIPPHEDMHPPLPPWIFFALAGATAITGGLAIASGVDTVNTAHRFDAAPSAALLDDGKGKQLRTNVAYGIAGVLGVATVVTGIWLVDWHPNDQKTVGLGVGFANARIYGTF